MTKRRTRRPLRALLRTVLFALLFSFVVGFGAGTWIRCQMEKPVGYLVLAPATFPLDIGLTGTPIFETRDHKE